MDYQKLDRYNLGIRRTPEEFIPKAEGKQG